MNNKQFDELMEIRKYIDNLKKLCEHLGVGCQYEIATIRKKLYNKLQSR